MNALPVKCLWDGESFVPDSRYQAQLADRQFVVGQHYAMVEHFERSEASHDHYFATLHDLWLSLPEHLAPEFPNEEVLRHYALIKTGYCQKRSIVCRSKAEAMRWVAFMRTATPNAIIEADGRIVTEWTAHSQAYRAMGKKVFQESKDAVLGYVSDLIGLPADAEQRRAA